MSPGEKWLLPCIARMSSPGFYSRICSADQSFGTLPMMVLHVRILEAARLLQSDTRLGVERLVAPDITSAAALVPFCGCINLGTRVIAKSVDPVPLL